MLTLATPRTDFPSQFNTLDVSRLTKVVLAVSGGGDSTALLFGFHDHWRRVLRRPPSDVMVVTINHNVRAASAIEAASVAHWCGDLGVAHQTLFWDGSRVISGFQATAREARYTLLAEAARGFGADTVLTGHTRDDQMETQAMRSQRADQEEDGVGVAGIAPATLFERDIWFVRPLLDASRGDLRHYLNARSFQWFDDPSNDDPAYERVRVRQSLAGGGGEGDDHRSAGKRRFKLARDVARWLTEAVQLTSESDGFFTANVRLERLQAIVAPDALGFVLMLIGGQAYRPPVARVTEAIAVSTARNRAAFTLAGCVMRRLGDTLTIEPEPRNSSPSGFGLDRLLPVWELPVLDVFDQMRGKQAVKRPPIRQD